MSQLREQLRKIMPKLSQEANQLRDPEARSRWMNLKNITMSSKSLNKACAFYGWSMDSYNKWGSKLKKQPQVQVLFSKSKKPHRSPTKTKPRKEKKVKQLRRVDPSLGPERISFDLKKLFNMHVPPSTVYAILKRSKMVSLEIAKKLTKKHLKRYRRVLPGYLQMDFKYVPYLVDGKKYYQLSCVDHHSSWRFIRIYEEKSTFYVLKFLNELKENCPFPIEEIQTDNDTAFTDKFSSKVGVTGEHLVDQWCKQENIRHRLIPVGVKELNGKVENTHKQDDREFFAKGPYKDLKQIQVCSLDYNRRWNEQRATKSLGWMTPNEVIDLAYVRATASLIMVLNESNKAIYHLDANGNAVVEVKEQRARVKIKTTKKKSVVEKYLQFFEWDSNKNRAIALLPSISQNSSYEF
jgi:transposase InsO family protein